MKINFEDYLKTVSKILNIVAGTALTVMMLLTVADVFLRFFRRPILGALEITELLLAVVIGFALPQISLDRGHVCMELLLNLLSKRYRAIMNTLTRILCTVLFIIIGYNLFIIGNEFRLSNEVSMTIELPFYPVAYAVGVCCFIECLVFILDIIKIWRGDYE